MLRPTRMAGRYNYRFDVCLLPAICLDTPSSFSFRDNSYFPMHFGLVQWQSNIKNVWIPASAGMTEGGKDGRRERRKAGTTEGGNDGRRESRRAGITEGGIDGSAGVPEGGNHGKAGMTEDANHGSAGLTGARD